MAATSLITYNQIQSLFRQFADKHAFIKSYDNGNFSDIVEVDEKLNPELYPLMFVHDGVSTLGVNEVEFSFQFMFMDIVHKNTQGRRTLNDIKSDMHYTAVDFKAFLENIPDLDGRPLSIVVNDINTGNAFTERSEDNLTGWIFDISIRQQYNYNSCSIPFE